MKTILKQHLKWFSVCLLIGIFLMGTQADAALPLNETFATSAQSVLLDKHTISYTAVLPEIPVSDDGLLYLFDMQPFEYTIAPDAVAAIAVPATLNPIFTVEYNNSRLYKKLGLAVKVNGQNVLIAYPQYISNPELLATHTRARKGRNFVSVQGKQFNNLFLSTNMNVSYPGPFSTLQILNNGSNQSITNPYARTGIMPMDTHPVIAPNYYMLNASEPGAINTLTTYLSKYAAASPAENYIIGNEVNNRKWNYMMWTDWDHYMREYTQAFRVCYNAIKSQNANARVFVCLDQNWDRSRAATHAEYYEYIDGKDFLDKFNAQISREGNIDWCVAQHPYPVPLTYAKFWDLSGCQDGSYMAAQVAKDRMITFQNLSVLTNYLQRPEMISPTGAVRHVILSEIGITNAQGAEVQAAAMQASYVAAKSNPYINEIIYLLAYSEPMIDTRLSGQAKLVFDSFGTAKEAELDAWARAYIGITDWSQVLR